MTDERLCVHMIWDDACGEDAGAEIHQDRARWNFHPFEAAPSTDGNNYLDSTDDESGHSGGSLARDILALAVPWASGGNGVVVTLGVYFDKSGPNDGIPAITVAGVISTVDRWNAFNEEWAEALSSFDGLPYFHMADFESGYGPYADWRERGVREDRLKKLLGIIERHVMAVVGASVSIADCSYHFADASVEVGLSLTASHCFNVIPQYRYLLERPREQVLYTFEAGDRGFGKMRDVYDSIYEQGWRREYSRMGGKLETDKKRFPPLQAADILAFEGWKQWAREHGGDQRPTRYPFRRLSASLPAEWATLRPTTAKDWLTHYGMEAEAARLHPAQANFVIGVTAPLTLPVWG